GDDVSGGEIGLLDPKAVDGGSVGGVQILQDEAVAPLLDGQVVAGDRVVLQGEIVVFLLPDPHGLAFQIDPLVFIGAGNDTELAFAEGNDVAGLFDLQKLGGSLEIFFLNVFHREGSSFLRT